MIQLELKVKHFYLIADILLEEYDNFAKIQTYLSKGTNIGIVANISQPVINNIRAACQGKQDDDLTTVETDVTTFMGVFKILSQKPEGSYNQVNSEMLDLLTPQMIAGASSSVPDWVDLYQQVTNLRAENLQVITSTIQNGKNRLYN